MKTGLEICNGLAKEIVAKKLRSTTGPVDVAQQGAQAFDDLTPEQREEFRTYSMLAIKAIFMKAATDLTAPAPIDRLKTGNLWDQLDEEWISADDKGKERVMLANALWSHHLVHRENQIMATRRQNMSFEYHEGRRDLLKPFMESDPGMTTRQAVVLLRQAE